MHVPPIHLISNKRIPVFITKLDSKQVPTIYSQFLTNFIIYSHSAWKILTVALTV